MSLKFCVFYYCYFHCISYEIEKKHKKRVKTERERKKSKYFIYFGWLAIVIILIRI